MPYPGDFGRVGLYVLLPWVPETFLVPFPVSVDSLSILQEGGHVSQRNYL